MKRDPGYKQEDTLGERETRKDVGGERDETRNLGQSEQNETPGASKARQDAGVRRLRDARCKQESSNGVCRPVVTVEKMPTTGMQISKYRNHLASKLKSS